MVNTKAVDFELENHKGEKVKLSDFKGKWIVLYFYPKDNTKGCTTEALDFSLLKPEFDKLNCQIIGISKDSINSHKKFIEKYNLNITLLSDPELKVLKQYNAWGIKKQYGREYEGTIRTTYLIDPEFNVVKVWKNVRVKDHAKKVLETLKDLIEQSNN